MLVWLSVWRARCRLVYGQLMPLPLTVSCVSKIQIGFTFLVPAHLGSPGQRAVTRVCVCWRSNVHVPMLKVVYMFFPINFLFVTCRPSGQFYHFSSARNGKTHLMGQKPALTTAIIHYIMQNHIWQLNYSHNDVVNNNGIWWHQQRTKSRWDFWKLHPRTLENLCTKHTGLMQPTITPALAP